MSDNADFLFIAAHADDLELAAGGTIAKAVADGVSTGMLELTHGEMGTRGTPQIRKFFVFLTLLLVYSTFKSIALTLCRFFTWTTRRT